VNGDERIRVNAEMLRLAREAREMTQSDLARRLGVPQSKVSKFEADLIPVSDSDLQRIASILDFPKHFFTWTDSVYGFASHEIFHRMRRRIGMRLLGRVHAEINIRQMQLRRLLAAAVIDCDDFPRLDPDEFEGDIERLAGAVRAAWHLPPGPVRNVTEAIENAGGIIVPQDFGTRQIDAVSQWLPDLPPVLFVNTRFPADRLRLSKSHELGHLVMHRIVRPEAEAEAYRFAAEFLMPAADIRHQLQNVTLQKLADLKPYWKVSMAALAKRAYELDAITQRQYRRLMIRLTELGYRLREPIDIPPEQPVIFRQLLDLHRKQLGYSVNDLLYLLGRNDLRSIYPQATGNLTVVA
jgi:Zn-dependent peptidase ImmA (M78 family)/transcriptional regulator with XRE-family HTH domain